MFDYVVKADADRRQSFGVALCSGSAALGILVGAFGLLCGRTALGLVNMLSGTLWLVASLRISRRLHR